MKSFRSVLIAFTLHFAAANEQSADSSQAAGLSHDKFKQYAAAFLGTNNSDVIDFFDSDDSDDASDAHVKAATAAVATAKSVKHGMASAALLDTGVKAKANIRGTKESVQHGAASAILLRSNDKQSAAVHKAKVGTATLKGTKAARSASGKIKLVSSAAATTVEATSTQLKAQLAQAVRVQYSLRQRLKVVGSYARKGLSQLLQQLQVAKAGAQRSEMKLQKAILEEATKRKNAEASEGNLRKQLKAAQASLRSANRAASDAIAHAATQSKEDRAMVRKLRDEFQKETASAAAKAAKGEAYVKETSMLRDELKASQTQAAQQTTRLRDQLRELQQAVAKREKTDAQRTQSRLTNQAGAQRSESKLRNEIDMESAKRKKAEASEMAAELREQKAELKSQKTNTELRHKLEQAQLKNQKTNTDLRHQLDQVELKSEKTNAELKHQVEAARASALSARRDADAATAKANARIEADRAAVRQLREEFQKETANLKREEAEASETAAKSQADHEAVIKLREELKASQMQAKQENGKLRDQLRLLQQGEPKAQSQSIDEPPKVVEAVVATHGSKSDGKVSQHSSTLQMMADFFAKPMGR